MSASFPSNDGERLPSDAGERAERPLLLSRSQAATRFSAPAEPSSSLITHHASLIAAVVVLLATALRLIALDRVPPGLFYDEAANGVDALRVLAGAHPVFFTGNQGREPLLIYLQAATFALIGPSPLALHIPTAMLGILTVAATYATFRAFFDQRVGLIAALLLAVSFWHLSLSRLAFRAVAFPLFATLATFWCWKGLHTGRARHFAISGVFLGLGLYTYIPSRLAPVLFAAWILCFLAIPAWRKQMPGLTVLRGVAVGAALFALTAFPLARYFYHHPSDFISRINAERQTAPNVSPLEGFSESVRALAVAGDLNPRHNLPGRPFLDLFVTIAAALGIALALRRWRDGASLFVLGWSVAMLAPAALSQEPWHTLRLVGELPFVLGLAALGFDWLARVCWKRRPVGSIVAILALLFSGLLATRDYFFVWATSPATYDAFEGSALYAPRLLDQAPSNATVFATSDVYEGKPIPLSLVPGVGSRARLFDGRNTFVTPADDGRPVYYAYAREFFPDGSIPSLDRLALVATSRDPNGQVDGKLFRMISPLTPPIPARQADATIGSAIRITGDDVQPVVRPGDRVHFALYWTVVGRLPPGDWNFFAHLVERGSQRLLGQDYNQGFAPEQWRDGDRVVLSFSIPVPADAPATVANIAVGVFDQTTGQRLPLADPSGRPAGTALICGPVRIDRPSTIVPAAHPLGARFGPSIVLLGYDLDHAASGDLTLNLHWKATQPVDRDYTVFVHLVDRQGHIIEGADGEPGRGAFPTSTWLPGEEIVDSHEVHLPGPPPAGSHLEVGMYLLSTGERLPAFGADASSLGDSIAILL